MPPTYTLEGIHAAQALKAKYPAMGVVILSSYLDSPAALRLVTETGGIGYLHKDRAGNIKDFAGILRAVARGEPYVDPLVVERLMQRRRPDDPKDSLSPSEIKVLALMAEGLSNQAIAESLTLGLRTVETHIAAIFDKLGLDPEADIHRRVVAVLSF